MIRKIYIIYFINFFTIYPECINCIVFLLISEPLIIDILIPESFSAQSSIISESFPAAIKIGENMLALGNSDGALLIQSARESFIEGMVAACLVAGIVALVAAIIVKWKLPQDMLASEE